MLEYENLRCDILELTEHVKFISSDSSYTLSKEERQEIEYCIANMQEFLHVAQYYLTKKSK